MNGICHYSQMQVSATSSYQKNYFQLQIDETINVLIKLFLEYNATLMKENVLHSEQQDGEQGQQDQQQQDQQQDGGQGQQDQQQIMDESNIRHFTFEELANYDGGEGREAYAAVNGKVYDVTMKIRWAGGNHFGLHAGQDLTRQFMGCHQGLIERLLTLPQIGVLDVADSN